MPFKKTLGGHVLGKWQVDHVVGGQGSARKGDSSLEVRAIHTPLTMGRKRR